MGGASGWIGQPLPTTQVSEAVQTQLPRLMPGFWQQALWSWEGMLRAAHDPMAALTGCCHVCSHSISTAWYRLATLPHFVRGMYWAWRCAPPPSPTTHAAAGWPLMPAMMAHRCWCIACTNSWSHWSCGVVTMQHYGHQRPATSMQLQGMERGRVSSCSCPHHVLSSHAGVCHMW